jgi:Family of unknown function (DUF5996)
VTTNEWPALPYAPWRETRDTLHMYTQVVGKVRLALSPFEPEWANVPLYLTARGLSTSPIPVALRTVDAEFDLIDHVLVLRTSDGLIEGLPLGGAVAEFYGDVMSSLTRMCCRTSHPSVGVETLRSGRSSPTSLVHWPVCATCRLIGCCLHTEGYSATCAAELTS